MWREQVLYPPVDHCYTSSKLAMHIYTRTAPIGSDPGIVESIATEVNLTGNYSCQGSCTTNGASIPTAAVLRTLPPPLATCPSSLQLCKD